MLYSESLQRFVLRGTTAVAIGALMIGCSSGSGSTDEPPATDSGADTSSGADSGSDVAEDTAVDSGGTDTADTGPGGCKTNADCATDPKGKFCLVGDAGPGVCVPCLTGTADECPTGSYCAASNTCETGCKTTADCTTSTGDAGTDDAAAEAGDADDAAAPTKLTCNTTTHRCVGCSDDTDCPLGSVCDATASACVPGCNSKHPCAPGKECCGTSCFDTQKDPTNCGTCGNACPTPANATAACTAGTCGIGKCNSGFENCDSVATNGCETETNADVNNCGACGKKCLLDNATAACTAGACTVGKCADGFADCDGIASNGCEVNLKTVDNCGACGTKCAIANADVSCTTGTCTFISCLTGFGDCDGDGTNGCESNLLTGAPDTTTGTVAKCGTCGTTCNLANAVNACSMGACTIGSCKVGFADCNAKTADGCEVNTTNDPLHCGSCSTVCSAVNGVASCGASTCAITCNAGFGDCTSSPGCETNLTTSTANCNGCGKACAVPTGATAAKCQPLGLTTTGVCAVGTCTAGNFDYDGLYSNGCECKADTIGDDCTKATDLGTIAVDDAVPSVVTESASYNLSGFKTGSTTVADEDWFSVSFNVTNSCGYHPYIELVGDPGVLMQVYTGCNTTTTAPTGSMACDVAAGEATDSVTAGVTKWEFTFNKECGDKKPIDPQPDADLPGVTTNFVKDPTATATTQFLIRVYRTVSPTTCMSYKFKFSN